MAARIYVIRGRRLFPSFLHLLYTTAAAASAASTTRWVVQRRGAGTTQLPRKLLHNKTACTFSYSQLSHPQPHPDDATIATDLRFLSLSPSLSSHLLLASTSLPFHPPLSILLFSLTCPLPLTCEKKKYWYGAPVRLPLVRS